MKISFGKSKTPPTFTQKIDMKMGKGFCKAVQKNVVNPATACKAVDAAACEAFKTLKHWGVNGPMRMDGSVPYQQKCDLYISLFGRMVAPLIEEDDLIRFQCNHLYKMVDDGMFMNIPFDTFCRQLQMQYELLPEVPEGFLDVFLEDEIILKDMVALWRR